MKLTAIVLVCQNDEVKSKKAISSVSFTNEVLIVKEKFPILDFSKVRNSALGRAKGEWVLFVDSDEIVSEKLKNEILYRFRIKSGMTGYKLKRKDRFLGKWLGYGETAGVRLLRLAKKDAGWWTRPVHEVWKVNGETGELNNPLLHYSHDSVEEMAEKLDRYSEMEMEYRFDKTNKLTKKQTNKKTNKSLNKNIVKARLLTEMAIFPLAKFVQNYIFRLGFLDGMEGFIHAGMMSGHSFLVRAKLLMRYESTNSSE